MKYEARFLEDDGCESPRVNDEAGIIYYYTGRGRYVLGDRAVDDLAPYLKGAQGVDTKRGDFKFPVRAHVHGSVALSIGLRGGEFNYPFMCHWDSGLCGVYVLSRAKMREYFPKARGKDFIDAVYNYANANIQAFNAWMTGDCWQVVIVDTITGGTVDSCCGFVGRDAAEEFARDEIARHERWDAKRHELASVAGL